MKVAPSAWPIRVRLALAFGLFLTLALVMAGGFLYGLVRYRLSQHHDPALRAAAQRVETLIAQEPDCIQLTDAQLGELDRSGNLILLHEVGGTGRVFYQSPESAGIHLPKDLLRDGDLPGQEAFETLAREDGPWRIYSKPYRTRVGRQGLIRVMEHLGDLEEPLAALRLTLLWMTPLAVILAVLGGYGMAAKALAPVDQITRLAQSIEAKNLSLRIPASGVQDEVGRLTATFNQMLDRLEGAFEAMKRFTADASHELRSPLTVMRSTLDITLYRSRPAEEYRQALTSLAEDAMRLQGIVEDLLVLARADSGRLPFAMQPVVLKNLAQEVMDQMAPEAKAQGVGMHLFAEGEVRVLGDERWLRHLLLNLVANALQHGEGEVGLTLAKRGEMAVITVDDQGPGIPPEHLPHVFERFYRADPSRQSGPHEGTGLGLAIARWVAEAHGGDISAFNREAGGATFQVRLPSCPPPHDSHS